MNCSCAFGRLCAVCGLLAACGAGAADINRCRDSEGHVLLSDQPCALQGMAIDDAVTETVTAVVAPAAAAAPVVDGDALASGARDEQVPAVELKRSTWADLPHPLQRRPVPLDASTMQAARSAMLMQDEMRRQRKLASVR